MFPRVVVLSQSRKVPWGCSFARGLSYEVGWGGGMPGDTFFNVYGQMTIDLSTMTIFNCYFRRNGFFKPLLLNWGGGVPIITEGICVLLSNQSMRMHLV